MKIFFCYFFLSHQIFAHEGPAYPILVDKKISTGKVSIWADPDTGKGTFDIFIEGKTPLIKSVHLRSVPENDNAHVMETDAQLISTEGERQNFRAVLPFDRELVWKVEFVLKQNDGTENSTNLPVEVTPPGPNRLEFALYFLPFLLLGLIWIKVMFAKRKIPSKKLN
jgi:hypothetical protein